MEGGDCELYLYLILEFQSSPDQWMSVRIANYVILLYLDLIKRMNARRSDAKGNNARSVDGLPIVLPIVIYNGRDSWLAPQTLSQHFRFVPPSMEKFTTLGNYFLLNESKVPEELLVRMSLVPQLIKVDQAKSLERVNDGVDAFKKICHDISNEGLGKAVDVWASGIVKRFLAAKGKDRGKSQEDSMLEENIPAMIKDLEDRSRKEGIEIGEARGIEIGEARGIEIGEIRGQRRTLLDLLTARFGTLPVSIASRLNTVSDARTLQTLVCTAACADSLAGVMEHLPVMAEETGRE